MMKTVVLALTAALFAPQAPAVDATLGRALKAHGATVTTRARFEQTLTNPLTGTTAKARGELLMKKPAQIAVSFLDPKGDRIVADGKLLWIYLPSQNPKQVIRLPQGKGTTGGIDVIGQFFDNPRSRYTITDAGRAKIGGRATHALLLVPKPGRGANFARATVWIDNGGVLRQFEVTDANGLVRKVELTKVETNIGLPASAFRFMMPAGAKIVETPMMQ